MARLPILGATVSPISIPSQGTLERADKQSCALPRGTGPVLGCRAG